MGADSRQSCTDKPRPRFSFSSPPRSDPRSFLLYLFAPRRGLLRAACSRGSRPAAPLSSLDPNSRTRPPRSYPLRLYPVSFPLRVTGSPISRVRNERGTIEGIFIDTFLSLFSSKPSSAETRANGEATDGTVSETKMKLTRLPSTPLALALALALFSSIGRCVVASESIIGEFTCHDSASLAYFERRAASTPGGCRRFDYDPRSRYRKSTKRTRAASRSI